jgi:phage terminase Nu1 subunit (DNA packaging protein)
MADRTTLDTTQMARLIDVGARHVRKLTADGILTRARNEFGDELQGRYEMVPNNHAYIHYLRKQGRLDEFSDARRSMLGNRKMAADAEMAELRLFELKGNLHRSDDVEFIWTNKLTRIKARIQAIPSRTARQLVGKTDYRDIHAILTEEVEQVLRECSGYNSADFKDKAEAYLEEQGAGLSDLAAASGTNGNGSDDGTGEEPDNS